LQAVGLLLVVALLIIPAAAARFWSHHLGVTLVLATSIGAVSALMGVAASALFPKLPAGAVIVLAAVVCFLVSFLFGVQRGLLVRWLQHRRVSKRVSRQHLLRAIYEWCELRGAPSGDPMHLLDQPVRLGEVAESNHWSRRHLNRLLRLGQSERLLVLNPGGQTCHLTARGKLAARTVTRNHRLWEAYLLHYADVAPQHIHHNADQIEHVIDPQIVNELEELVAGRDGGQLVPSDPEKRVIEEISP
jgi:manganese/zinc/iron transport system permease protein